MTILFFGINNTGCGINATEKTFRKIGENFVLIIIFINFYEEFISVVLIPQNTNILKVHDKYQKGQIFGFNTM